MFFRDSEACLERYDSYGDFGYLTKNQKKIIWREICKRTRCPSIVTLTLLLFIALNPISLRPTRSQGLFLFAVNILKIPQTWNTSIKFSFILPQKIPVSVSAHAYKLFSSSLSKKNFAQRTQIAQPPRQLQGWPGLQKKYIWHIYNFVKRLHCKLRVVQN